MATPNSTIAAVLNWLKKKAETSSPLDSYPIGAVYISTQPTDPASILGGGWKALNEGRVLIGANTTYPAGLRLDDPAWDRVIVIEAHGTKQTVTWNPGTAADTEIGDMQPGEWRDFVAIEAAACREYAIELAPGESHALTQRISVENR